ncbi:hypothetical protein EZ313_14910 [Ramlibacter henchirensis]|uniref:NIPSNAP domain-containing protein n=1 Tax=Ramlibacter henchirensis TaxID=204072 RepID=A0A4Z0BWD2_9BURK|nr:hypothetical protein [Ramlibacter henchirensis]TFZ02548.1 hypothetical protein EZ313_14910 [Ramlibacter henchirensis]
MALLGGAALAMWWNMAPQMRAEFEHWHTHEHFPERLGIPGFRRASRWVDAAGGEGIFVLYELEAHGVLSSGAYLRSLNAPTPWSTRMMPHHRDMVRSQCRVLASAGGAVAGYAATVRLSPASGAQDRLQPGLQHRLAEWAGRAGLVGAHLLRHEAPAIAVTTEQKIRGGDSHADWVLVLTGYDAAVLEKVVRDEMSDAALAALGARSGSTSGFFRLSHSCVEGELAGAQAP